MGNADRHRDAHEAFNRRDWPAVAAEFAADATYTDVPRGITVKGPQQIVDHLKGGWATAFSDAAVTGAHYIDGGDHTVAQFTGTGTNDGPLGPMPASGRRMALPFCEVLAYDADDRVLRAELYYDQVSMLVQLGHMPPPAA